MFKQAISASIAIAAIALAPANASPIGQWTGTWEATSSGLVSVTVKNQGGNISVSAKGKCTPNPCDWGTVPATAFGPNVSTSETADTRGIIAVFNNGFSTKTLILDGQSENKLRARVFTRFTDNSGRSDYVKRTRLKRKLVIAHPGDIATPVFKEDCISFNPNTVSVENPNGSWKLVQGSMWMLDAGPKRNEMRKAKRIVQHYGLNKQCFVGRPNASLRYWLVGNQAPSGNFNNEDCVGINPNNLSIRNSGSHFTIVSNGNHFAFTAPTRKEAKKVIATIKRHGFTKSCFVGRPGPSMAYLRK